MRAVALAGVLLASACSFKPGVLSADALLDDAVDDAMIDVGIDADLDPDGDGVLVATDNCPAIANADQHDEDADLKGDLCDPCPQGGVDTDTDGDMIGDGCDPHPATAGDVLVRFDGFGSGSTLPAAWTAVPSGTDTAWSVGSDSLVASVTAATNYYIRFDAGGAKTTVDVGAALAANAGTSGVLAALVDVDATVANSYSCATRFDAGTYALVLESAGSYSTQTFDNTAPPTLPDTYRYRATLDAGGMTCRFTRGGATGFTVPSTTPQAVTPNLTGVAVRIRDISATIQYIAIYTSP